MKNIIPKPIRNMFSRSSGVAGYAQGGIVTRPTLAMIGEDGAEAVVPLTKPSRANQIMHQITNNRSSGGSYVFSPVIHVNGGDRDVGATVKTQIGNCYKDFERFMQRYEQQKLRTAVI